MNCRTESITEPNIGIVVCGFIQDRQFVTNAYIQAIRYAKGLPLLIPLIRSDMILKKYTDLCDGFLFCGGEDITPLLFGQEPVNGNGRTNITLDLFQIRLMRRVLQTGKPVLSICRGMQVYNVACGGTIYQDISLQPGKTLDHMQDSYSRSEVSHKIFVEKKSQLCQYIGHILYVNSYHHQTIEKPGKGLSVCARASDQTIEALEMPSHPFAIGVQWHPEAMYRTSSDMRELFRQFVLHAVSGQ